MPQKGTKSTNHQLRFLCLLWLTTAADEVNNLNPIIVVQHRCTPIATTHHFPVEFDRNSSGRQIELGD